MMGKWKSLTKHMKKNFGCVGCEFIGVTIGWPCNRCPRQKMYNPDMHSQVNINKVVEQ
jgi:hypothetical protein